VTVVVRGGVLRAAVAPPEPVEHQAEEPPQPVFKAGRAASDGNRQEEHQQHEDHPARVERLLAGRRVLEAQAGSSAGFSGHCARRTEEMSKPGPRQCEKEFYVEKD